MGTSEAGGGSTSVARRWTVDPSRSTVEFSIPTYWGFRTVTGRFHRFAGFYDRGDKEAVMELTVDTASLDTGDPKLDERLRSRRFFASASYPQLHFSSTLIDESAGVDAVAGRLDGIGSATNVVFEATVRDRGAELELEARTTLDPRELGVKLRPLGMMRPELTLHVDETLT